MLFSILDQPLNCLNVLQSDQESKEENEEKYVENWKGLATLRKKKMRKPYYSRTLPEILYINERNKIGIGILLNGSSFHKTIKIGNQSYFFVNTCCIDTIAQMIAAAYCDSLRYKDFLSDQGNKDYIQLVEKMSTGAANKDAYILRGNIIVNSQNNLKSSTLLNGDVRIKCEYNAAAAVEDIFQIVSIRTTRSCFPNCHRYHQNLYSKTVPININIIKNKGFMYLEEAMINCIEKTYLCECSQEGLSFNIESMGHIFIDTCDCGSTTLKDLPLSIAFNSISYILRGVASFQQSCATTRQGAIGHYTALTRRIDGVWESYDDYRDKIKNFSSITQIEPHLLLYTI